MTPKQKRFVEEYLVDLNATQAAIRAGYSEKTAGRIGSQLLVKTCIANSITKAQSKRSVRTEITQDMVLRELAKIGFSDIRNVIRWGNTTIRKTVNAEGEEVEEPYHGIAVVDSSEISDDAAAAISEISETKEGLKVKLHDKKGALVEIAKHLGMFVQKVDVTTNGNEITSGVLMVPAQMTDEEWESGQKSSESE